MNDAAKTMAEMSDDELLQMDPSRLEEGLDTANDDSDDTLGADAEGELNQQEEGVDDEQQDQESQAADTTGSETGSPELEEADVPDIRDVYYSDGDQSSAESAKQEEDTDKLADESGINYKEEYLSLLKPFKAAKREVQVRSVDDARRLMQQGVDYVRKMEELKPLRKVIKTLQKNDLADMDKINFLIDIQQKKPEAIKKLLKDSSIDPLDIDLEDQDDYVPTDHTPNDQELAIEEVLDEIGDSETFDKTVEVITKSLDKDSKEALVEHPHLIRVINDHISAGIYDQIMNVVQQERLYGRLKGMSDLAAYQAVGDAINAKGGFEPYQQQAPSPGKSTQVSGSGSSRQDEQLRKRKQAASPTRSTGGKSKVTQNFLASFTDEEIEKMGPSVF